VPNAQHVNSPLSYRNEVKSVTRALTLLRCFTDSEQSFTLTELANRTGLNLSTVHRLLRTLCLGEFLDHDAAAERYVPGPALVRLARSAFISSGLADAVSVLNEMVATTGESASLGVRDDMNVLVVLSAQTDNPLRFARPPGARVPLHVSAMGKALLAFGAEPIDETVRSLGPLEKWTAHTLTSRARLARDLRATRDRGFAIVDEEQHLGLRSVGAPIRDSDGVAQAAVALQGPTARIALDRLDGIAGVVTRAAGALEERLALELLARNPAS
jgi:IclR family acetate operon transcriptional repressor